MPFYVTTLDHDDPDNPVIVKIAANHDDDGNNQFIHDLSDDSIAAVAAAVAP